MKHLFSLLLISASLLMFACQASDGSNKNESVKTTPKKEVSAPVEKVATTTTEVLDTTMEEPAEASTNEQVAENEPAATEEVEAIPTPEKKEVKKEEKAAKKVADKTEDATKKEVAKKESTKVTTKKEATTQTPTKAAPPAKPAPKKEVEKPIEKTVTKPTTQTTKQSNSLTTNTTPSPAAKPVKTKPAPSKTTTTKPVVSKPAPPKKTSPPPPPPKKTSQTKTTVAPKTSKPTTKPASKPTTQPTTKPTPKASKPAVTEAPKAAPAPKAKPTEAFFKEANTFFGKYVSRGLIAYSRINKTELKTLVDQIATMDLSSASTAEKQAFYINAYNVLVIKSLLDNKMPKSPLDVGDFFKKSHLKVAGSTTSLDKLEKKTLFGLKNDARYHFVLVCGAKGCPPITNFAYQPSKLESQLASQTRKAMNDSKFIRVNDSAKKVELSKIFEWYAGDFGGTDNFIKYVNKYRTNKIPTDYEIGYYEYDWNVNKQ